MPAVDQVRFGKVRRFFEERVPFHKHLGLRLTQLQERTARMELPFQEQFLGNTERGALHGGLVATLIDTCAGAAVFSLFSDREDRTSTIDLRIDYLRPARAELVAAEARVVRAGSRRAVVEVSVFHPGEELDPVATGKGVFDLRLARQEG